MKKILKVFALILGTLFILILVFFLFVQFRGIPSYEVVAVDYKLHSSSESIERGKKLTTLLCANCHMNLETRKLTGRIMKEAPTEFGKIYSQNITQDKEYGIGTWSDSELVFLLRTGIKRDGKYSPPYMAKLPTMADEDINAIISFLRSDDPMVRADPTMDFPCEPSWLTKFLCLFAFKPFPYPSASIEMPDSTDQVEIGKYLAHNLECYSCHSADFKSNNFLQPELSAGYFGGGNKPLSLEGKIVLTSNLTPDMETGIGGWSEEKFVKAVKSGIVEGQPALRYPMVPFIQLTDDETAAIFAYLKTIPPIKNKVNRSPD